MTNKYFSAASDSLKATSIRNEVFPTQINIEIGISFNFLRDDPTVNYRPLHGQFCRKANNCIDRLFSQQNVRYAQIRTDYFFHNNCLVIPI